MDQNGHQDLTCLKVDQGKFPIKNIIQNLKKYFCLRFCAVALDDFSIAIIGGEIQSENGTVSVSNDMSTLNVDTKKWTGQSGKFITSQMHCYQLCLEIL